MPTFPYAHQKLLVLNGTVVTSGNSSALTAGDFGLYDKNSNVAVSIANAAAHPYVYLAQGSYYTSDKAGNTPLTGLKESVKSPGINAKYVRRFYKIAAQKPASQVLKVGGTAGVQFLADVTYRLRVEAKGAAALRLLNHDLYKHVPFYTGCGSTDCLSGCDKEYVDSGKVYKGWADSINADPLLSLFVRATAYTQITTTTATYTTGASKITVASVAGLVVGQTISGSGVYGVITSINGLDLILNNSVTASATAAPVSAAKIIDATYVPAANSTTLPVNVAYLVLEVAYIDTVFSDCSFHPTDFYQKEPVIVYVSLVDERGDLCSEGPHINSNINENTIELQAPVQGEGLGESVIRDYIQSRQYEGIHFSKFSRKREIELDPVFTVVSRGHSYNRYYLQFNVPRFANSTNTFSNDQFLYGFSFDSSVNTNSFEDLMNAWLTANNPSVALETIL
jgi:hypothetical protein